MPHCLVPYPAPSNMPSRRARLRRASPGSSTHGGWSWFWLGMVLAAWLGAPPDLHAQAIDLDLGTSPDRQPHEADVLWRVVRESPVPLLQCPSPAPGWRGRLMFDFDADPERELPNDPTPIAANLRRFCLYETMASHPNPAALGVGGDAQPDRIVVVPLAGGLADAITPWLQRRFLTQAGVAHWPMPTTGEAPDLVLIDTTPTNPTTPPHVPSTSSHGDTLAHIARRMLCRQGQCLATLSSQLALPYTSFDPTDGMLSNRNELHGGALGTLADLATALVQAVEVQADQSTATPKVLNLSLGWNPLYCPPSGASPSTTNLSCDPHEVGASTPAVRAVFAALQEASCRGALIVAAAGNRTGGPHDDAPGAFLPAAWEAIPAPTAEECAVLWSGEAQNEPSGPGDRQRSFERNNQHDQATGEYHPLLYAAAGAAPNGALLVNARAASVPPRVAFADHAVTHGFQGSTSLVPLTGSSAAAMVVSSAAAMVWRYRPQLSPPEVMATLFRSGTEVATSTGALRSPDVVCTTCAAPPNHVRNVNACAALHDACAPQGSVVLEHCPAPNDLPYCHGPAGDSLDIEPYTSNQSSINLADFISHGYPSGCGGLQVFVDPDIDMGQQSDPALCPGMQYDNVHATPFTGPQPEEKPCPPCAADCCSDNVMSAPGLLIPFIETTGATLHIEIAGNAPPLCAPTITIGDRVYRVDAGNWPCLAAGSRCELFLYPVADATAAIDISFAVSEDGTACDAPGAPRWSLTNHLVGGP